jgi:uncharacterized membrane protein HdeD (DUF308 family)
MERVERAKTFQEMVKEGTFSGTDTLIATGIAMIVIGFLAILAPMASGLLFNMLFGALFIGAGIVEFIDAFRAGTWQRGALLGLAGLVALAAGILFIARPVVGLIASTVVFLAYLIFVGAFRIVMAVQLPRGAPGRFWAFASGVVAIVLAYLAIGQMPNVSTWLIGTYVGVSLIFTGVSRISLARGFRRTVNLLGAPAHAGAHA